MRIISIDPSISNIGYAIYSMTERKVKLGTIRTDTKKSMEDRIQYICRELTKLIHEYSPRQAVIEKIPEYSRKTYNGRSVNHGSLMRLHMAVGAIQAVFMNSGIPVHMSPALTMSKLNQKHYAIDICADAARESEHARAALIHLERYLKRIKTGL